MEDKSGRESKKRLWDTGRYLVGCLLLLCMAGKSYAQGDDFGVWTSAEVKKRYSPVSMLLWKVNSVQETDCRRWNVGRVRQVFPIRCFVG